MPGKGWRKIRVEDVLELIKDEGPITVGLISDKLQCSNQTIRRRIRDLLDAGHALLGTHIGYLEMGDLFDQESAELITKYGRRYVAILDRLIVEGKVVMPTVTKLMTLMPHLKHNELLILNSLLAQASYLVSMEITVRQLEAEDAENAE